MRILHCCLSCFYIDGYSYQENLLPHFNHLHGNEVEIIASTETFDEVGHFTYVEPSAYQTEDGIKITRVAYSKLLPAVLMRKIRLYKGVYKLIEKFAPDVILFHGMAALELLNVVKYVKKNPHVKLYIDGHGDYHVCAKNPVSRIFLHEWLYRSILKKALPHIDKVLYITEEVKDFNLQEYKIPEEVMEYYPLGGDVIDEKERDYWRKTIREQLQIDDSKLVLMHTGKLDKRKETAMLIQALNTVPSEDVLLLISGNIPPENEELWDYINGNERVKWLGWLNADELRHHLCACDVYAQPGGQSATMQNAVCCGVPVMIYPHKSHLKLCKDNVIWVENADDIRKAIHQLLQDPSLKERLSDASFKLAKERLDYGALAKRLER